MDSVKIVDCQNAIIKIQSDVIDELFLLLMQHITADEAGKLPVIDKINVAAKLRADVEQRR